MTDHEGRDEMSFHQLHLIDQYFGSSDRFTAAHLVTLGLDSDSRNATPESLHRIIWKNLQEWVALNVVIKC